MQSCTLQSPINDQSRLLFSFSQPVSYLSSSSSPFSPLKRTHVTAHHLCLEKCLCVFCCISHKLLAQSVLHDNNKHRNSSMLKWKDHLCDFPNPKTLMSQRKSTRMNHILLDACRRVCERSHTHSSWPSVL